MSVRLSKEAKALGVSIFREQFNTEGRPLFGYANMTEAAPLDKAGFVNWNQMDKQGDKVAVILTETGVDHFKPIVAKLDKAPADGSAAPRAVIDPSAFELRKDVPIPVVVSQRGSRETKWPWDKFEVGMSIFVPKSETAPDPAKSLKSTIAAVNRKYSKLHEAAVAKQEVAADSKPKTWQIAPTTEGGVDGAVIHRIA